MHKRPDGPIVQDAGHRSPSESRIPFERASSEPTRVTTPNSWMAWWGVYLIIRPEAKSASTTFRTLREQLGRAPVVLPILHQLMSKGGILPSIIEKRATSTPFAIVERRHAREHAIVPQRDPQRDHAYRLRVRIRRKLQE